MVKSVRKRNTLIGIGILIYLVKRFPKLRRWSLFEKYNYQEASSMDRNNEIIKKIRNNESIFAIDDGEKLSINNSRLSSSGNTTNEEESTLYGLNAGILAKEGSRIDIKNSTITTMGKGANALFSSGENSLIDIDNIIIKTKGQCSNGIGAGARGTVQAHDISINTEGKRSSAVAVYKENGIIDIANSSGITEEEESPCIYSRGNIVINDSSFKAEKSEAAIVDASSLVLNNTSLTGRDKNGIMLFQSTEKNKEIGKCVFTSNLGSITVCKGAVFYVTNTEAIVSLFNTKINLSMDNILVKACKDKWGTEGNNGGSLILIGNHQTLKGDVLCDELSSVSLSFKDYTYFTGALDAENKGKVSITLDSTSAWTITKTSYIDYIIDENKDLKNIIDNGYNIYYNVNNEQNSWLSGKEHNLPGGGKLIPA